jgi:hypothetical protein
MLGEKKYVKNIAKNLEKKSKKYLYEFFLLNYGCKTTQYNNIYIFIVEVIEVWKKLNFNYANI